jgi:iron complex transport system substrate-binding protein
VALAALACRTPSPVAPVSERPSRIVSLSPALTEILFALGAGDRIAGVTDFCDWPEAARAKPKVGGYANPAVEAILALGADLVVVSPGPGNRDAALALRHAGIRVEVIPAETLPETYAAIEALGSLCGESTRGIELAAATRARVDAVSARVAGAPRVKTLFSVQADPIIAAGSGTLPAQLVEAAGGTNVVRADRYPRLDVEAVLAAAPDVILQSRMDAAPTEGTAPELDAWMRWKEIPAVRENRVVLLAGSIALRPGPRVGDAAEAIARILHPDRFAEAP